MTDKEISKRLIKYYQAPNLRLSRNIEYLNLEKDTYILRLKSADVIGENMQKDSCAFEGWALAIYGMLVNSGFEQAKIRLEVNEKLPTKSFIGQGHLCRFLYRVLRFSEQYKWFLLSPSLAEDAERFKVFLSTGYFTNNIGSKPAGTKCKAESIQEERFSTGDTLKNALSPNIDFGENPVYRQLPVGLFEGEKAARNKNVFTGGASAIDLWSWNKDILEIIELKAGQKKIGIIAEIFFYCNYMRDLVLPNGAFHVCNEVPSNKDTRGYEELLNNSFLSVFGIMLADAFHPCIGDTLLDIMNDNGDTPIQYRTAKYNAD